MRFSPSKTVFSILLLFTLFVTWLISRKLTQKTYTQTCNHSEKFHQSLHSLADRVHNVLASIGLTHFLCYGSLWGQLRSSKSLPWESDIEYCLLNEEIITRDEVYLARIFRSKKMNLEYDITEGVYTITDTDFVGGKVQLIVFEKDPQINMLRRVGWKRRVLPPDCESLPSLNCFPPRLATPPLPLKEFGGYIVPVPREGIEIQKYHYPTNWWKEILPKNC
ncbi:uncharacterized protein [Halyomorpha halys]|uniref:uncharacterized protein n=1 Tax=Halyomorpha halys TaxID=286706 RepID=UPI0006D4D724|nr:uncharacterized protein LOC106689144 [Halyomorpha halys]XP_014289449.1 uncharacterized protein LOC106689144 [Halyomorpha halys]XP_014289450.1 uncharacterized protein LOC106689144 [Halyomorpha halys]